METLIPKLFIITAEASLVLFLILLVVIIFNSKAKRKDIKAANELLSQYVNSKEERISAIKTQLKKMAFSGDTDEQAEQLFNREKSLLKNFVSIYLRRDTYRMLDYPDNLIDVDDQFLKTSGAGSGSQAAPDTDAGDEQEQSSEANANATILAREQAESNEAHLKELSELRLKNTELNEQLFEALETITTLMTEHGKKTGQEVETNAQKILDAIIYLRDQRLGQEVDPSKLAPSPDDDHDQVQDPWSVDLASSDGTLDDSTAVNLGISEELNTDLDSLEEQAAGEKTEAITKPAAMEEQAASETSGSEPEPVAQAPVEEEDPWATALEEQAATETSKTETESTAEAPAEEEDPWASALEEQAASDTEAEQPEEDPWAEALAEQAATEAESEDKDEDPWAAALAEQEKTTKK